MDRPRLRLGRSSLLFRGAVAGAVGLGAAACGTQPPRDGAPSETRPGHSELCLGAPPAFGFCGEASSSAAKEYAALFAEFSQHSSASVISIGRLHGSTIADGRKVASAAVVLLAGEKLLRIWLNEEDLRRGSLRAGDQLSLQAGSAGLMLGKDNRAIAWIPSPALLALSGHAIHGTR